MMTKNKIKNANFFVEPDEIFLDSKNIQNFDQQQFEGRIEKPISKKNIILLGSFFVLFAIIFIGRLQYLQIKKGEAFFIRSENNTFEKVILFADRGIIYDRNRVELAWNKKIDEKEIPSFGVRSYISPGFSHVLGYGSSPIADKKGQYWQAEFVGKDGLEKVYGEVIKGENGAKMIETDAHGEIQYQNIVNPPKRGADLVTTLDSRIQKELFILIQQLAKDSNYFGGAGIIMDVNNGEILASTSFPEYDGEVLSSGKDSVLIKNYLIDKRKVFLDRTISGLYTPGSIIKPFLALGALTEGIIDPNKEILSTGSISIPNPYDKTKETIFKDWKAHGWTAMREAIAVSSDVYFYSIGGGFEGQSGLGIANIGKYSSLFKIGEKTGVDLPNEKDGTIPSPKWKTKNFKGDPWRIGDTYHTSIGQYGFQVTPIEMVRAIAAIANYGTLVIPHFILGDKSKEISTPIERIKKEHFDVIHEGMREAVTYGTALSLNVPYLKVAAKTGTAQLGVNKNKVNSWVVGFFPYENPKYAFTVIMEAGPANGSTGTSVIMRRLLDWMYWETPEYFGLPKKENKAIEEPLVNDLEVLN